MTFRASSLSCFKLSFLPIVSFILNLRDIHTKNFCLTHETCDLVVVEETPNDSSQNVPKKTEEATGS